ncbi:hypothetical protein GGI03_002122 [Coemansia sp. RSA 2337]|nr:hypothetical protein GGI03_002122 [Coemansia sp. RSA 2337]
MPAELEISYDLAAYAHLEAMSDKPELYLNRYFAQHFYGKLCTIGVAQEHPLLDLDRQEEIGSITKIEFTPSVRSSVIAGKAKKQSMKVMSDTKLCTIYTSTGKEFIIRAAVRGLLMEWNSRLEEDPQLLTRSPYLAFIAIIKPPTDDDSKILADCQSTVNLI